MRKFLIYMFIFVVLTPVAIGLGILLGLNFGFYTLGVVY